MLHNPWYVAAYLGGCAVVMFLAFRQRRSALLFLGISFFLTPLVGLLTVLLVGPRYWTGMPVPEPPVPIPQPPPVPASAARTPPPGGPGQPVAPRLRLPAPVSPERGKFHVVVSGEPHGPYMRNEMRALLADGLIDAGTLCWHVGLDSWLTLREAAPELGPYDKAETPDIPSDV